VTNRHPRQHGVDCYGRQRQPRGAQKSKSTRLGEGQPAGAERAHEIAADLAVVLAVQSAALGVGHIGRSSGPTEAQQALYSLPQSNYNSITGGNNGYSAGAGYNLVTGLGTPVANLLVSNLVAYQGPGTSYSGPTVGPLQSTSLDGTWTGSGGPTNVFSVFDSLTATGAGINQTRPSGVTAQKRALAHGTNRLRLAERPLTNLRSGVSTVNHSAPGDVLAQPLAPPVTTPDLVADQVLGVVLDADSHDSLIGDLAFERILSGTHKVKGTAPTVTTR
jgi:hypothetical protein